MNDRFLEVEYLASILNSMSDMVRVITREGRVALTNDSYKLKLADGVDTIGQHCHGIFKHGEECETCVCQNVFDTGLTQQTTRKHNNRVYSVTASPLIDRKGKNVAVVEVFRDVTLDYNIRQNLMAQNTKMQRDLQMARNLQKALIKNVLPTIPGYNLRSGFFPCEAVGGDIFDCLLIGDRLIFYIADVSGHGVMPAMLAVFFMRSVRTATALGYLLPSNILQVAQKEFISLDLADSIYITGFIVVLDIPTGEFTYANAGHSVVPVLYDGKGIQELYMSAPPISSWFDHPKFRDKTGRLEKGSRLLLYSDGIHNIHTDEEVKQRLYNMFVQESFVCDNFIEDVKRELHTYPKDDFTMLLCCRECD